MNTDTVASPKQEQVQTINQASNNKTNQSNNKSIQDYFKQSANENSINPLSLNTPDVNIFPEKLEEPIIFLKKKRNPNTLNTIEEEATKQDNKNNNLKTLSSKKNEEEKTLVKPKTKSKKNSDICNICRDGGDLILCDKCPKSFHKECILLKSIDETKEWYCTECTEVLERIKKRNEERSLSKVSRNVSSNNNNNKIPIKTFSKNQLNKSINKAPIKNNNIPNNNTKAGKNSNSIININFYLNNNDSNKPDLNPEQKKILTNTLSSFINKKDPSNDESIASSLPLKTTSTNRLNSPVSTTRSRRNQNTNTKSVNANNAKSLNNTATKPKSRGKKTEEEKEKSNYDGNKLSQGASNPEFESKTFSELNDINYIINKVIKENKVGEFIVSYLNKAKEDSDPMRFKPKAAPKKKKKKKPTGRKLTQALSSNMKQTKLSKNSFRDKEDPKTKIQRLKQEKELKIIEDKKKLEEMKRKEEEKKYLNVKYPIDDEELYSKWDKYKLEESYLTKPEASSILIPDEYFMKVMKVHDFLHSFNTTVKISNDFSIEMLYYSLTHTSYPEVNLVKESFYCLINLIIDSLCEINPDYYDLDAEEREILLLKIIFRHTHQRKEKILNFALIEVLKILIFSEQFDLVSTDKLKNISKSRLSTISKMEDFFSIVTIDEKLEILSFLINCSYELKPIREQISSDISLKTELKKEKNQYEIEIKSYETRKKELERTEKQTKPQENIDRINNLLEHLAEENEHLGRKEVMKKRRELEIERDNFKQILKEMEDIEVKKNKLILKIEKLMGTLSSLSNNSKRNVGIDGFGNQYYIFRGKNNMIRVHVKRNNKNLNTKWGVYTKYTEICNLMNSMTEKGRNEKALINKLKGLSVKQILSDSCEVDNSEMISEQISIWINGYNRSAIYKKADYLSQNPFSESKNVEYLVQNIEFTEKSYTDKLHKEKKEWDSPQTRQEFLAYLKNTSENDKFKKCILLLNNAFKKPMSVVESNQPFLNKNNIVVDDEDEEMNAKRAPIIDDYNNPNVDYKNINIENDQEYKDACTNMKIWKPFIDIGLEEFFITLVENSSTLLETTFIFLAFAGLINKWTKEHIVKFYDKCFKNEKLNEKTEDFNDEDFTQQESKYEEADDFNIEEYMLEDKNCKTRRQAKELRHIIKPHMNDNKSNNIKKADKKVKKMIVS